MAWGTVHFRFLWGAFDLDAAENQTPTYVNPTDYASLGATALPSAGIGVRRATLHFDRTTAVPADDDMNMHFDFLNITGGNPDDTWIAGDFTTLETLLQSFWTSTKPLARADTRFYRISWHRIGPGIVPPNPAERILDFAPVAGTIGAPTVPPQVSCSITFRTAVRKHWGRTYFPMASAVSSDGRFAQANVDTLCTATQTLFTAARAADFAPVMVSNTLNSALGIETVETDTTVDIIRRRRWKHTTYRKLLAA